MMITDKISMAMVLNAYDKDKKAAFCVHCGHEQTYSEDRLCQSCHKAKVYLAEEIIEMYSY